MSETADWSNQTAWGKGIEQKSGQQLTEALGKIVEEKDQ